MKLCYVDESGNQASDPCLVMVGILADSYRLNRTREEFGEFFDVIQGLFEENLKELKGAKIIFGRDRWRKVDPEIRKRITNYLCEWVRVRKHGLLLAAIDRKKWFNFNGQIGVKDEWLACSLHIALQIQKYSQGLKRNKGHTILIFDENKAKADSFAELLWDPPAWTDDFYERKERQERFDQLIDSAFTVKSHHAGLVQIADLYALIFRRYAEIAEYGSKEEWSGESRFIDYCVKDLSSRLIPRSIRWPSRTKSKCAKWFNSLAPESLVKLGR